MDGSNKNEMEQIQRGLEAFLEKEMDSANPKDGQRTGARRTEPGEYDAAGRDRERARRRWQPEGEDGGDRSATGGSYRARRDMADEDFQQRDWDAEERDFHKGRWHGGADRSDLDGPYADEDEYYGEGWEADGGEPYGDDWDAGPYQGRREDPYRGRQARESREPYGRGEGYRRRRIYEEEEPYRGGYPGEAPGRRSRTGEDLHAGERYVEEPPYSRRQGERRYDGRPEEDSPRRRDRYEEAPDRRRPQGEKHSRKKGNSRREDQSPWEEDSRMTKKSQKKQGSSKKKPRKKKHRLLKFLVGVAVLLALLGFGLYQLVGVVYGKMTYREIASASSSPMTEDGVVNILLIGNDSRQNGEDGRSDAMILLSISSRTKTIHMTSLLRDMYVEIPGYENNRLNAAYSYGGPELLMETIEKNFDIPVNRYMLVNFGAFVNLVDAVGGIDLELTNEEVIYINGYLVEYNILTGNPQGTFELDPASQGMVHLNGPQALAYSRNRLLGTDFGRTERQRKILTAVIGKLPGAVLTNAGGLIDGLMPNLTTNLTKNECFRLSLMAGKLVTYDIVSDSIPQPNTYRDVTIRKMMVLEVDFEANIRHLKEKLYGK